MMTTLLSLFTFALGLACGGAAFWWLTRQKATLTEIAQNNANLQMRESFQALSGEVLAQVSQQATQTLLTLAEQKLGEQKQLTSQELDGKKQLIDQNLNLMQAELKKVNDLVTMLDKDRQAKFTTLADQLSKSSQQMEQLRQTTHDLKSALSNARIRGQWGDRMADDVLRLAGFVEGINYLRQVSVTAEDGNKRQPDYTFFLPGSRVVHMDVKFPLDQYLKFLESTTDAERETARRQFIKEARARVAEASKREYAKLDTTTGNTLDYTLVFIPNEQVYSFLLEHDREILDTALSGKVILCSPTTLFAILAVIRQAVENFQLERTTGDILRILRDFQDQWERYTEAFLKLGERLNATQKDYDALATTRSNQLERQLGKLNQLKLPHQTTSAADVIDLHPDRKAG